jgi:hypothetical protein
MTTECKICNKQMKTYRCPRCDKPVRKVVRSLNLIHCLDYIQETYFADECEPHAYHDTTRDKVWGRITDEYAFKGNNSFFQLPMIYYINGEWDEPSDAKVKLFFEKLVEEFELDTDEGEDILWEVYW